MTTIYHVDGLEGSFQTKSTKSFLNEVKRRVDEGERITAYTTEASNPPVGWLGAMIENAFPGDIRLAYTRKH